MKKQTITVFIFIFVLLFLLFPRTFQHLSADLDGDGMAEEVSLKKGFGKKYLYIKDEEGNPLLKRELTNLNPQDIKVCDLEGDGVPELFIAVKKPTYYHKECWNRPFFFNYKHGHLYKKWTGSKFGDPFVEAFFIDYENTGKDYVFTIDKTEKGSKISAHVWYGFGFYFIGESPFYDKIEGIEKSEDGIRARIDGTVREMVISREEGVTRIKEK